jgi:dihydrofolate synthase/folylpolyglutamate synthase
MLNAIILEHMQSPLDSIGEAVQYLLYYSPEKQAGETYTLGRMRLLMERLGNPQNNLKVIHVAGTSGKTSTAYYVRALLEAYGQKTGLTSSPHIVSITERIQIGGKPLPDELFLAYLNEFLHVITAWPDIEPTYFELLIAFAFWVFSKEQVDYAVVEVGLGGLLDATNVIHTPKICVITPIGLDHTEILGNTTRQIATQKAGIITHGSVVFSARQDASAEGVIYDTCRRQEAVPHFVYPAIDQASSTPLFQQENFGVAKAVTDFIEERDRLPAQSEARLAACITQNPPGRFEIYQVGNKTIILDGAHNPQKLEAFVRSLRPRYPEPIAWLIGFIAAPDSKIAACVEQIINPHDAYTVTEFSVGQDIKGRRSVPASEVLDLLQTGGVENGYIERDAHVALQKVLEMKQRTVVVSGSLYLVAKIRQRVIELAT